MFKDVIIHEKYKRTKQLYTRIFNSVLNILTQNMIYDLKLECIIKDTEIALWLMQ